MECPDCGGASRVMETRPGAGSAASQAARTITAWMGGSTVFRRRQCTVCCRRWCTSEVLLEDLQALHSQLRKR